jgi:hypothetical protein
MAGLGQPGDGLQLASLLRLERRQGTARREHDGHARDERRRRERHEHREPLVQQFGARHLDARLTACGHGCLDGMPGSTRLPAGTHFHPVDLRVNLAGMAGLAGASGSVSPDASAISRSSAAASGSPDS